MSPIGIVWWRYCGVRIFVPLLSDSEVRLRCDGIIAENKIYRKCLEEYTRVRGQVAITDFRPLTKAPTGNRFLVYSLFPETFATFAFATTPRIPIKLRSTWGTAYSTALAR